MVSATEVDNDYSVQMGTRVVKRATITEGRSTELEIIIGKGYAIYGTVTGNGKPMAKCMVTAEYGLGCYEGTTGSAATDKDGKYRIEKMGNGNYIVTIFSEKFRQIVSIKVNVLDKDVKADIDLSLGSIAGVVTDAMGAPIDEVRIHAQNLDEAEYSKSSRYSDWSNIQTDETGKYEIANVNKGRYRLSASKDGYASESKLVTKGDEQSLEVNFQLQSPGVITGKILDTDGLPLKNAFITIFNEKKERDISAGHITLGANGEYLFDTLPEGNYEFIFGVKGYAPQIKKVSLTANQKQVLDFTLHKGPKLCIHAIDENGNPIEEVKASFNSKTTKFAHYFNAMDYYSHQDVEIETNKSKDVVIDGLPSQKFEISIQKDGYVEKTIIVDVGNEDVTTEVVLEKE